MAGKPIFDKEAAFKSIIGVESEGAETSDSTADQTQDTGPVKTSAKRGRPKLTKINKKRISLAVYPDDYDDLQKIAYVNRQSVSDIITRLISEYVKAHASQLEEYDRLATKSEE